MFSCFDVPCDPFVSMVNNESHTINRIEFYSNRSECLRKRTWSVADAASNQLSFSSRPELSLSRLVQHRTISYNWHKSLNESSNSRHPSRCCSMNAHLSLVASLIDSRVPSSKLLDQVHCLSKKSSLGQRRHK